ncbi:hypothetical protein D3C84_962470 [compost metagenome]
MKRLLLGLVSQWLNLHLGKCEKRFVAEHTKRAATFLYFTLKDKIDRNERTLVHVYVVQRLTQEVSNYSVLVNPAQGRPIAAPAFEDQVPAVRVVVRH